MEKAFLSDEIWRNQTTIAVAKLKYNGLLNSARNILSPLDFIRLLKFCSCTDKRTDTAKRNKHQATVTRLMHFRFGNDVAPASSNVTNLSARVLDGTELFIFSHGLKFSLPPKLLTKEEVHTEFEVLMAQLNHHKHVSTDKKQELKARLVDLAYGYCGTPIEYSDWKMVGKCRNTLNRLKRDDTIKILKPDKGSGMVILNTTVYIKNGPYSEWLD